MNAMLAPAVTMIRLPRATSMPFSAASLRAIASTSARQCRRRPGTRGSPGRASAARDRFERRRRRTVVHDALAERNRARRLPDQVADDGDDRRLDRVHPRAETSHGLASCCLGPARLAYSCSMIRRRCRVAVAFLLAALRPRARARSRRRVTAAAAAAAAGTVYRVQGRRRQQAGALGQDRRVHAARRRRAPTASASASSGKTSDGNPFIALEISSRRHAEESRSLQAARAQAVLPGRRADRRASATRSSGRARSSCSSPAASTRPRSARRRWRSSSCTGSRPTTRRR